MKKFRITLTIIFSLLIFSYGFKIYQDFKTSKELKKEEKIRLRKSAEVLNKCFDLENKSKRSINESMDLIEYCLNNYGAKNH